VVVRDGAAKAHSAESTLDAYLPLAIAPALVRAPALHAATCQPIRAVCVIQ
jgi:hypothetical protein